MEKSKSDKKEKRKRDEEPPKKSKKAKMNKQIDDDPMSAEGEVKKPAGEKKAKKAKSKGKEKEVPIEGDEPVEEPVAPHKPEDEDAGSLVHESMLPTPAKSRKGTVKKVKFVPQDETSEQRDSRTIFVGNVAAEVAKSKVCPIFQPLSNIAHNTPQQPLLKQFKRHILSFTPSAQIESVRFRSIAFQKPTTKLPTEEDETTPSSSKSKAAPEKQPRKHDVERISTWRDSESMGTVEAEKKYLTPEEKKRVAYIKHDFHDGVDVVTAYVVFAHPKPTETRAANVPAAALILDPYEASRLAVEKCDGTVFNEKTIRVDHANKDKSSPGSGSTTAANGDPKLSVFVGNLDFASKEEDLRVFFEGLVSTERGAPPPVDEEDDGDESGDEGVAKTSRWVTRVRIIRDKDTQLGKGFAYVQFAVSLIVDLNIPADENVCQDRECVDEVLALEQDKIKFAKRKLRVQRCKNIPAGGLPKPKPHAPRTTPTNLGRRLYPTLPVIPRGDPSLGKQLEHLSKDERKQRKSEDADRVARRLAKKKVKSAMDKAGVKAEGRERSRKRSDPKKVAAAPKAKRRIRSEANLKTRNAKK